LTQPPASTLFPYTTLFRSLGSERLFLASARQCCLTTRLVQQNVRLNETLSDNVSISYEIVRKHFFFFLGEKSHTGRSYGICEKRSEEHTSELQSRGHLVCR